MPSAFASLYSDSALPALSDTLGEQVLRYPLGDLTAPAWCTAIWADDEGQDNVQRGHENVRKVALVILDATVPDTRDLWALPADFPDPTTAFSTTPPKPFTTRSIDRGTDPAIVAHIEYREMELRTGKGGHVL
ncbi:MAG: hypothetical protein KGL39_26205 [Patescibacteria group bacterium]|nr:hypothetical protein [Patescibacteria group bacterium]